MHAVYMPFFFNYDYILIRELKRQQKRLALQPRFLWEKNERFFQSLHLTAEKLCISLPLLFLNSVELLCVVVVDRHLHGTRRVRKIFGYPNGDRIGICTMNNTKMYIHSLSLSHV